VTSPQGRRHQLRQPGTDALAASSLLPGAAVRCAPTDVRRHFAAASINAVQYPLVAEFAVRLTQDRAEQEFADGLRDLLDRFATTSALQSRSAERRQARGWTSWSAGCRAPPDAPRRKH